MSASTILRLQGFLSSPQHLMESCLFMFSRTAGSANKITPLQASVIVQTLGSNSHINFADPMQELASSDHLTFIMLRDLVSRLLTNELNKLLKDKESAALSPARSVPAATREEQQPVRESQTFSPSPPTTAKPDPGSGSRPRPGLKRTPSAIKTMFRGSTEAERRRALHNHPFQDFQLVVASSGGDGRREIGNISFARVELIEGEWLVLPITKSRKLVQGNSDDGLVAQAALSYQKDTFHISLRNLPTAAVSQGTEITLGVRNYETGGFDLNPLLARGDRGDTNPDVFIRSVLPHPASI